MSAAPSLAKPLLTQLLLAVGVYTFDVWVLGQGGITTLAALIAGAFSLVAAVTQAARRRWTQALLHLAAIALWIVALVGAWTSITMSAKIAHSRADTVIAACRDYQKTEGHYPDQLDQLVPRYLPGVPRAKYTVLFGEFRYRAPTTTGPTPHGPSLVYVTIAPFMRNVYDFDKGEWFTVD